MNQSIREQHQSRFLPGLIKFYLLQLYPLVITFFAARLALGMVGVRVEQGEIIFWSMVAMLYGFAGVLLLIGLHTRAKWAPRFAGNYNLALLLLVLVLVVRIVVELSDMRLGRMSFNRSESYLLLLPAFLLMQTPALYAWYRYFTASPKVARAFAITPKEASRLPEMGIAFLRVLSASYLIFFITLLGFLAFIADGRFSSGTWAALLTASAPFIIIPAIISYLAFSPGRRARPLLIALGVFLVFICLWKHGGSYLWPYFGDRFSDLYKLLHIPLTMPMPLMLLLLCTCVLGWKIWADKNEQEWFAGGNTVSRTPDMFSIYAIVILFHDFAFLLNMTLVVISDWQKEILPDFWLKVVFLLLGLALAVMCVVLLYKQLKQQANKKNLALFTFGLTFLLLLVGCVLMVVEIVSNHENARFFYKMRYGLAYLAAPMALSVFALLHWRARYRTGREQAGGFFGMPAPYLAFALLCLLFISSNLPSKVLEPLDVLFARNDDAYRHISMETILPYLLLRLEYWAACLVFPILAMINLKRLWLEQKRFYLLGVFWLLAIASSMGCEIASLATQSHLRDYGLGAVRLLDATLQIYAYVIVIFMLYLAMRDKTLKHN